MTMMMITTIIMIVCVIVPSKLRDRSLDIDHFDDWWLGLIKTTCITKWTRRFRLGCFCCCWPTRLRLIRVKLSHLIKDTVRKETEDLLTGHVNSWFYWKRRRVNGAEIEDERTLTMNKSFVSSTPLCEYVRVCVDLFWRCTDRNSEERRREGEKNRSITLFLSITVASVLVVVRSDVRMYLRRCA